MKMHEGAPPELVLRAILVRGGAFIAEHEFGSEGIKRRLFFVANLDPTLDDRFVVFTATTQEIKRRAYHGARADLVLVPLDPRNYSGVKVRCVIDCESATIRKRAEFEQMVVSRKYAPLEALPFDRMEAIAAAVQNSRTMSSAEKRLVLGSCDSLPDMRVAPPKRSS